MPLLKDMLDKAIQNRARALIIQPGAIVLGPMPEVEHLKFYIIAGISGDRICACSVVINSKINPFIQKRPKLMAGQVSIFKKDYTFLDHDSFINCAQPLKGRTEVFNGESFDVKDILREIDLQHVIQQIKDSGSLTPEEIEIFFK